MISTAYASPQFDQYAAGTPQPDAAAGLVYATRVLEVDGFQDFLAVNEAPKLSQAAGGNLVSSAVLQGQIDDAARVVAAYDPSSVTLVQRLQATTNDLGGPPKEAISSTILNGLMILGGILSVVLGILPAVGFVFSPWLMLAPLGLSLLAYLGQLWNNGSMGGIRERQVSAHEDAILALLRRADELRAQAARQAQQTAFVGLDTPAVQPPTMQQQATVQPVVMPQEPVPQPM